MRRRRGAKLVLLVEAEQADSWASFPQRMQACSDDAWPHNVDDGATAMELSNRHRDTIEHIFDRPSSGNVEWREVLSLLEAVGDVDEEPNGRYRVTFGGETEVFVQPHGKDVDVRVLVDLRRMLRNAGLEPPSNSG